MLMSPQCQAVRSALGLFIACVLLLLGLRYLGSSDFPAAAVTLPPASGEAGLLHKRASMDQVMRALGWSMVSGLATGVGGMVVFCLDPPDHGRSSSVSNRMMAALLGLAVGVMLVRFNSPQMQTSVAAYELSLFCCW